MVPGAAPGGDSVDDHDALGTAHLEGDVHAGGAAVDQSRAGGHTTLPEVADQNGTDAVVTAQQVAAADDQNRTPRRFDIQRRGLDIRTAWVAAGFVRPGIDRRDHTIPLMTNFDSSLPVLPS